MSKIYQRLKGTVNKYLYYQPSSFDSYPYMYDEETGEQLDEYEDNINDNVQNVKDNKSKKQKISKRQPNERIPVNAGPLPTTFHPPSSEYRNVPNGFQPVLPQNNNFNTNVNPPVNTNAVPISDPAARAGLPFQSQIQGPPPPPINPIPQPPPPLETNLNQTWLPPINPIPQQPPPLETNPNQTSVPSINRIPQPPPLETNPNQTSVPSINRTPQSSLARADFTPIMNRPRRPIKISPNSTLVGFPSRPNSQSQIPPSRFDRPSYPSFFQQHNRPPFTTRLLPPRSEDNIPNIEVDYPIENVLIDENIPSSIAIKINEAVEHDRFGNTHYTHHYAYKPKTQHITMGNNQQIEGQLIENSHPHGMRYIREINNENSYPQKQFNRNWDTIQLIIDNTPQIDYQILSSQYDLNYFPMPINHFIARALPNDPMRNY